MATGWFLVCEAGLYGTLELPEVWEGAKPIAYEPVALLELFPYPRLAFVDRFAESGLAEPVLLGMTSSAGCCIWTCSWTAEL